MENFNPSESSDWIDLKQQLIELSINYTFLSENDKKYVSNQLDEIESKYNDSLLESNNDIKYILEDLKRDLSLDWQKFDIDSIDNDDNLLFTVRESFSNLFSKFESKLEVKDIIKALWGDIDISFESKTLVINDVDVLSDKQMKILSQYNWDLNLSCLREISDYQAQILSNNDNSLDISGLIKLSDYQSKVLSSYPGYLEFNSLEELWDNQLKNLSKHGRDLSLIWLKQLTDNQVESLSKYTWSLTLNVLKTLTNKQIDILSKYNGSRLDLLIDGNSLNDSNLSKFNQYWWNLRLNLDLTDSQAEILSNFHVKSLTLHGNWSWKLSENQIKSLSEFKGRLNLQSLTEITDNQAEILSNFQGNHLQINSLQLTNKQAKILSKYQWQISVSE